MCGIFALIEQLSSSFIDHDYQKLVDKVGDLIYHRGPDSTGSTLLSDSSGNNLLMVHTRLKINGNDTVQPLYNKDKTVYLVINGEIFNWKELEEELGYQCESSDCEIILPLYEKYKYNIPLLLNKLNGQFSFVLYDTLANTILVARDSIGVTPLYIGSCTRTKRVAIASEMKCLTMNDDISNGSFVDNIKSFYPRQYIYCQLDEMYNYNLNTYKDFYMDNTTKPKVYIESEKGDILNAIRQKLTNSVQMQLSDLIRTNVPFGVLLSGGLDSSLIASLVVRLAKEMGYTQKVKTFSIGVNKNVPDLVSARKVADYLGTDHYEYYFSISDGLNALEKVIWHIESYDCTSVRASTPMYLLVKQIKNQFKELKVLFSGELSDELLCYLYGANAPNENEFQMETVHLVSNVHLFDCLRANKTCMANSVEVRVPFTDDAFVDYILNLHPRWKMFGKNNKMEKQILRESFDGYLPNDILYRKKEQFSDGVSGYEQGTNWIDGVKTFTNDFYLNEIYEMEKLKYNVNRPDTKEKLYYRQVFCKLFNDNSYKNTSELTVKQWVPNWSTNKDPSGRVQLFWEKN